ncbi:MAG: NAD(P)/FAD-dependent oxidoreductase, partial [bacterium]
PMKTVWAYVRALRMRGVRIEKFTEVKEVFIESGRVKGVGTNKGSIFAPVVVNAAGGWSQLVARLAKLELPVISERHQILVTEPVDHLFDCMVISFKTGLYIQQVPHGSLLGGISEPEEPGFNMESSWQFVKHFTKEATRILPILKNIRIVRQWAGLYNKTPDAQPILCESDEVQGFYLACGFSGHGFMVSPMTGEIIASLITKSEPPFDVSYFSMKRFKEGKLIVEPSVVG